MSFNQEAKLNCKYESYVLIYTAKRIENEWNLFSAIIVN